jgi:S-adenosylmethionine decarboxylase
VLTKLPADLPAIPAESNCSSRPVVSEYDFIGRHFMASYVGCAANALHDLECLEDAMQKAVRASGATLLNTARHVFPTGGATIVMLLSESHASIHTYPEHDSCFVDLFTCGLDCQPEAFDAVLRSYLRPAESNATTWIRQNGAEHEDTNAR